MQPRQRYAFAVRKVNLTTVAIRVFVFVLGYSAWSSVYYFENRTNYCNHRVGSQRKNKKRGRETNTATGNQNSGTTHEHKH